MLNTSIIADSKLIRKDFLLDYSNTLTENGFIRRGGAFYRVHSNDVLIYVRPVFFSSEWTIAFGAYPFSIGYTDMKGYDGIRLSSFIRRRCYLQNEPCNMAFYNREISNYQSIRNQYRSIFFDSVFPEFNRISDIKSYIGFVEWHMNSESLSLSLTCENLILASLQSHDFIQGTILLEKYLSDNNKTYKKRIADRPDNFTIKYEQYSVFLNDIKHNNTSAIDDYINTRIAVTIDTCKQLKIWPIS